MSGLSYSPSIPTGRGKTLKMSTVWVRIPGGAQSISRRGVMMTISRDRYEERAAEYISVRNHLVRDFGYGLNSSTVNQYEERAANALSRAKGK